MASEILAVPEHQLEDFIAFILEALEILGDKVSQDIRDALEEWCREELEYLDRFGIRGKANVGH